MATSICLCDTTNIRLVIVELRYLDIPSLQDLHTEQNPNTNGKQNWKAKMFGDVEDCQTSFQSLL